MCKQNNPCRLTKLFVVVCQLIWNNLHKEVLNRIKVCYLYVLCVDLRYVSAQSALYAIDLQLITCTLNKRIQ